MLRYRYCLLVLIVCGGLWAQNAIGPKLEPQKAPKFIYSGVALQVNGDSITSAEVINSIRKELDKSVRRIYRNSAGHLNLDEFVKRNMTLIRNATMGKVYNLLMYQYAKKDIEGVDGIDKAIEGMRAERRKEIILQHGGSETRARKELAQTGTTIEKELKKTEREMVIGSYREKYFTPTIKVTRSQLLQYYRAHLKTDYIQKASVEFQLIDISKKKHQDAAQRAREALAELKGGKAFGKVAEIYSDGVYKEQGGKWRPIEPGSVRDSYKPVIEALLRLEPGDLTGLVETEDSIFIGQLIKSEPQRIVPFSQVQKDIISAIRDQRWDAYSGKLGERLMKEAVLGDLEGFMKASILLAYDEYDRGLRVVAKEE